MRFSTEDERAMRLALDKAHSALLEGEIPVGCVIVDPASPDVPLIATHNEVEKQGNLTAHAEILALSRVERRHLRGSTMYVTLEPCPMCAGALARLLRQRLPPDRGSRLPKLLPGGRGPIVKRM